MCPTNKVWCEHFIQFAVWIVFGVIDFLNLVSIIFYWSAYQLVCAQETSLVSRSVAKVSKQIPGQPLVGFSCVL